jgi:hypothetical protein
MARNRFHRIRTRYSSSKRRGRSKGSSLSPLKVILANAVYGAVRPYAANMLPDFFNFGPVSSDNVILGGVGALAMSQSNGWMKALGVAMVGQEAGIVGAKLSTGMSSSGGTSGVTYYG